VPSDGYGVLMLWCVTQEDCCFGLTVCGMLCYWCYRCCCCHQVHGSDAEEASKRATWSQMPRLVLEAARLPLLWYFAAVGLSCEHSCHSCRPQRAIIGWGGQRCTVDAATEASPCCECVVAAALSQTPSRHVGSMHKEHHSHEHA
jgi:hypothetical protein